jgi:hypothetical protein
LDFLAKARTIPPCYNGAPQILWEADTIDIRFCVMKAEITEGQMNLNDHEKVTWVQPMDLLGLDLTPADQQIARALVQAI